MCLIVQKIIKDAQCDKDEMCDATEAATKTNAYSNQNLTQLNFKLTLNLKHIIKCS